MSKPPNEFAELRQLLDSVPEPKLKPVDVSAILAEANPSPLPTPHRPGKFLLYLAGLAAAVLLGVLLGQVVSPQKVEPSTNQLEARLAKLEAQLAKPQVDPNLAELKELLLTLAADVNNRDYNQQQALARLTKAVEAFELATQTKFNETEKTQNLLYSAVFKNTTIPGGNP